MNFKEIMESLPGNVLANIIAAGVVTGLALIFGFRGKENNASQSIRKCDGQRIHISANQGTVIGQQAITNRVNTKVISNYGVQNSSNQSDDEIILYGFLGVFGFGALMSVAKIALPIITPLPLTFGIVGAVIAGFLLCVRWAQYTTVALRKAILVCIGLATASIAAFFTMLHAQDLENSYSILAISEKAMSVPGGEKPITGAISRFLYLADNGNQKYLFAFLLSIFAIIVSWLICFYYLKKVLGSLLFPASSNGKVFNETLTSINTDFVESRPWAMCVVILLSLLMTWLTAPGSFELLASWIESWQDWLAGVLESL